MIPWGLLGREGITRPCSTYSHTAYLGTSKLHGPCTFLCCFPSVLSSPTVLLVQPVKCSWGRNSGTTGGPGSSSSNMGGMYAPGGMAMAPVLMQGMPGVMGHQIQGMMGPQGVVLQGGNMMTSPQLVPTSQVGIEHQLRLSRHRNGNGAKTTFMPAHCTPSGVSILHESRVSILHESGMIRLDHSHDLIFKSYC
jgi:hypothetical protein